MSRTVQKSHFANPQPHGAGINFKVKLPLLGLNEISRSAQKSLFSNCKPHVSVGGERWYQFTKINCQELKEMFKSTQRSHAANSLPSYGWGSIYKSIFP